MCRYYKPEQLWMDSSVFQYNTTVSETSLNDFPLCLSFPDWASKNTCICLKFDKEEKK